MSIKVISYDLGGPETSESYRKLLDTIYDIGSYVKPLESFFLVDTYLSCTSVRDRLSSLLDYNDKLIVIDTGTCPSAWTWADTDLKAWIEKHR